MFQPTVGHVLESLALRFPNDTALIEGDRRFTFSELLSEIRGVGNALRNMGLRPGDRVGILMKDSVDLVLAMYGGLWSGITTVPMNIRLSPTDHSYMLGDAGVRVLLYHGATAEHVAQVLRNVEIDTVLTVGAHVDGAQALDVVGASRSAGEPGDIDAEAPVWVQYTGGTTGLPKGVVHSHRTLLTTLASCTLEFDVGPGERSVLVAPLTHAGASLLLPVWMRGGTNILLNGFDAERLFDAIELHRATITTLVPTMIQVMLESPSLPDRDLSSLRTMIYGGAPITPGLQRRALEAFGPVLIESYGQIEVFAQISALGKADHLRATIDERLFESAGRPVSICDIRIADDAGNEVPTGEFGEILVRGPHMFLEYLNKPDETAAAKRGGWVHTGDMGHRDENGYLFVTDRAKDVVISGGFNVYPREVELVLEQHPGVLSCCVVGLPDEKWGERVTAVIIARDTHTDRTVLAAELTNLVREAKGAVYAPKQIEFVDLLPMTAVGKLDKRALVRQLLSA